MRIIMNGYSTLLVVLALVLIFRQEAIECLDNGLAITPPMGWISWERFTCEIDCVENENDCISYKLYERTGKSLKDKGFVDLGYQYVNIDDCWSEMQRENGLLVPDNKRFGPDGITELSTYLKTLNIKLGIYGDCGSLTCAHYPSQLKYNDSANENYFDVDSETFYKWGVESFKFDGCFVASGVSESICPGMTKALTEKQNDRPAILVTCEWPFYMLRSNPPQQPDYEIARTSCNLWRYFDDIFDSWQSVLALVDFSIKMQDTILVNHRPGGWFDPDQIVIGGFGLSPDQERVQMAIWSIWSAPLFMSNDLDKLNDRQIALLQNKELIKVNQDPLGIWALMVREVEEQKATGKLQVFVKPILPPNDKNPCPSFVVAYLYRGALGNTVTFSLKLGDLLADSKNAIEEANKRRKFNGDVDACINKLRTENNSFEFVDLLGDQSFDTPPTIESTQNLVLSVNPTGIRVVKLTELKYKS